MFVEYRQCNIGDHGGKNPTLRGTGLGLRERAVLDEDARLKERLHQRHHTFVSDPHPYPI
jgi:hypothetical protein